MYLCEFSGFFPHQSAVPTIRLVLTWRFLWRLVPKHGFPNRLGNHPKISQLSFLSFFLWVEKLFLSKFSLKHHFISSFTTCLFFILLMAQKLKCLKLESARQLNQPRSSQIPLRCSQRDENMSQPDESMGNPSPRFSSLWVSEASLRQRPQRARNRCLLWPSHLGTFLASWIDRRSSKRDRIQSSQRSTVLWKVMFSDRGTPHSFRNSAKRDRASNLMSCSGSRFALLCQKWKKSCPTWDVFETMYYSDFNYQPQLLSLPDFSHQQ